MRIGLSFVPERGREREPLSGTKESPILGLALVPERGKDREREKERERERERGGEIE